MHRTISHLMIKITIATIVGWFLSLAIILYTIFEGQIHPVISPMEIHQTEAIDDNWTRVVGSFEKIRDCDLVSVRWFYGSRDFVSRIDAISVPTLVGQEVEQNSVPIELDLGNSTLLQVMLDPELITDSSYAYVYHRCHGPYLWTTRSLFYDSEIY